MFKNNILAGITIATCINLIPQIVNAVSLSFTPKGSVFKEEGHSITFKVFLNPDPEEEITFKDFKYKFDGT